MKTKLTLLCLSVAGLCAAPSSLLSADPVPPKPPGGTSAPPAAEKPAAKPDGERRGPGARMNPEERLKRMTEALSLTPEQQDKIKAIFEGGREEMAKLRDVPEDQRREKFGEFMKAQNEKVMAVLTPEQQEKYKNMIAERMKQAGDRKPGEGRPKAGDAK